MHRSYRRQNGASWHQLLTGNIMKLNLESKYSKNILLNLFAILSMIVFAWILINRNPFLIRPASVAVRYGYTIAAPLVFGCLLAAYYPKKALGIGTAMVATFILFGMVLNGLWASGQTESVIISGLLPWSDPSSYYSDALGWLEGFKFGEMSAIRPIFPSFLSLLFGFTGKNLQFSIALLVFLIALSSFIFSQKVKESLGFFAAAVSLLLVFFYIRRISGTTLSENLGIVFSLLGYANLLIGAKKKSRGYILLGAFLVSMSLNTRPGPFFILIAIILWSGLLFIDQSRKSKKDFVLMVFLTGLVVASPFAVNTFIQKTTAAGDTIPFANFSYAFYGLVSGGEGYTQVFIDHPELRSLSGNSRHFAIFELTFEMFKNNPLGFFVGSAKHLKDFLQPSTWYSMFGYVGNDSGFLATASRATLEVLSVFTLAAIFRRKHDPILQLIVLVMITTLLSVPFVPPGDAHKLRLYAAAIPIIAMLPAVGFMELVTFLPPIKTFTLSDFLDNKENFEFPDPSVWVTSMILCILVITSPFLSRSITAYSSFAPITCPEGQEAIYFEHRPGSYIFIWPEEEFFLDRLPNFHSGRFKQFLHGLPDMEQMANFQNIEAPTMLSSTIDIRSGKNYWVILDPALLPDKTSTLMAVCGQNADYLFKVDEVIYSTENY